MTLGTLLGAPSALAGPAARPASARLAMPGLRRAQATASPPQEREGDAEIAAKMAVSCAHSWLTRAPPEMFRPGRWTELRQLPYLATP